ncbi:MAG TPA: hypothetical protein VF077_12655 [Nitrospiraceae bacterium]
MPPNTIVLSGHPNLPQEMPAGEAGILPGMLLQYGTGGNAGKLMKHASLTATGVPMFAVENTTPDRTVATVPIETPYQLNETVKWIMSRPGDLVYALVPAGAAAIVAGAELASNADGTLKVASTVGATTVALAAEALNNSGGSTTARIRVRAI